MDQKQVIYEMVHNTEEFIRMMQTVSSVLNDRIQAFPENKPFWEQFVISHFWTGSRVVNVFEVIGTAHPDYIGATWIEMLRLGKRMRSINLPLLEKNPGYYFETSEKVPEMHYVRVNDKLYIGGEGNHRTSIAKVLFSFLGVQNFGTVKYEEYVVDFEAQNLFREINDLLIQKSLPARVEVRRRNYKRDDTPGWKKDYYILEFEVINPVKNRSMILDKEGLKELFDEIKSMFFLKKIFGFGKFTKIIL